MMPLLAMLFLGTVLLFILVADKLEERRTKRLKTNVLLSMVRRFMPTVIAHDIVGVQPMTAPSGNIFTLRYIYNEPHQLSFPFPYPEPVIERVPVQMEMFGWPDEDDD